MLVVQLVQVRWSKYHYLFGYQWGMQCSTVQWWNNTFSWKKAHQLNKSDGTIVTSAVIEISFFFLGTNGAVQWWNNFINWKKGHRLKIKGWYTMFNTYVGIILLQLAISYYCSTVYIVCFLHRRRKKTVGHIWIRVFYRRGRVEVYYCETNNDSFDILSAIRFSQNEKNVLYYCVSKGAVCCKKQFPSKRKTTPTQLRLWFDF